MFESCSSLADLNAARAMATQEEGCDLIAINNSYNKRRQEILEQRKPFVVLSPIVVQPREAIPYCGVPVCGPSVKVGCITLTKEGFLV